MRASKLIIAAGLLCIGVVAAMAQATVTLPATVDNSGATAQIVISAKPFIESLQPYIISAAGGVIIALGGMLVSIFNKWGKKYGLEIDAQQRDALIASAKNVAAGAIASGDVLIEDNGKITLPPGVMAAMVKDVIETRAPDAVAHFGLTPADVEKRISEQVPQVFAASSPAIIPQA